MDNPLLDYLHARQLPRPWRDVLPALAHALAARLSADELRAALRETGQAFARQRPVAASETVAAMQDAMNAIWDREDWGWVEIDDQGNALLLTHRGAPLRSAFGDASQPWSEGFLEGAYEEWFRQLGAAPSLSVTQQGEDPAAGIVTLRFGQ